jgi:hypothetical protein
MAEQPENEAETPATTGYRESSGHVPDPTAMSGTLETTETGGGNNDRISGMTDLFGRVEQDILIVRDVVEKDGRKVVEEIEHVLHDEDDPGKTQNPPAAPEQTPGPSETPAKTPAKKAAEKKTTTSDAAK